MLGFLELLLHADSQWSAVPILAFLVIPLPLSHLSLSSFYVSFQTWYLPGHLVHAAVVCINPATTTCYPAVSAWLGVHAELLSCWPHGSWWFLPSEA